MTDKQAEMWTALEAHQSQAEADKHGHSWRVMCKKRTSDAAYAAYRAAPNSSARLAARKAAAAASAKDAAMAKRHAQEAIEALRVAGVPMFSR
jgi:hypothetical protein